MLRICSYCWVEEREGESGLCPVGEVVVIEDATRYEDDDGNEIPGGLERAELWELLAKRHGLEVPQHLRARRVTKRRKTKKQGAVGKLCLVGTFGQTRYLYYWWRCRCAC
jgi:hypothetical protein